MKSPSKNSQNGQVIIGALLLFLTISITVLVGIATPVAIQVRTAADFLQSKQGYISADVLNEEALYRLNQGRTLPSTLVLSFNDATSTALITDVGGAKQVIATGISGAFTRLSKSIFSQGEGISINYGLQVGDGGLTMSGSPTITGNVISNGNISGSGVSTITGSAIASTASVQTTDQSNGSGVPAVNTTFGNANATQDFAQSFTVSTTTPVARVMLYIKKDRYTCECDCENYNNFRWKSNKHNTYVRYTQCYSSNNFLWMGSCKLYIKCSPRPWYNILAYGRCFFKLNHKHLCHGSE